MIRVPWGRTTLPWVCLKIPKGSYDSTGEPLPAGAWPRTRNQTPGGILRRVRGAEGIHGAALRDAGCDIKTSPERAIRAGKNKPTAIPPPGSSGRGASVSCYNRRGVTFKNRANGR